MYNELTISTPGETHTAYFMNGFHVEKQPASNLHKHNYAEIHLVCKGNAVFDINGQSKTLHDGNIMVIPHGVFHCCIEKDVPSLHTAFQIDYTVDGIRTCDVGTETVQVFFREIEQAEKTGLYTKTASYIALFCSQLGLGKSLTTSAVTDYGFIINEYISLHYRENLHLSDLARELHLSERQTERLVRKYTGNSFRDELCSIRVNVAKQLFEEAHMSLREIAEYVGYESYAGFWKAAERLNVSFPKKAK